jgi:dihydropyrimidine dehydrogenase (NADP+)
MKFGHELIKPLCEALLAFMEKHKFETLDDFRGYSLDYFTSHTELVRTREGRKRVRENQDGDGGIKADGDWSEEKFVEQSAALSR